MKSENEAIINNGANQNLIKNDSRNSKIFSEKEVFGNEIAENNLQNHFDSCFIDHSLRQIACIYEHCSDHNRCFKNEMVPENLNFNALRFHPDDRKLWCERAFPDILKYTDSLTDVELLDYMFSFNHRYIRNDGSVSQFLHEGFLMFTDNNRLPVLNMKVFTEIGDIKTDETIVLSVFMNSVKEGFQKIFTKVYSNTHNSMLTQRELEIIRLCRKGLSSKMIADKLKLSIHTVKNHKRNSMEKTLTHNITELIHLCIQNYWL